jgi:hypothetical protein
MIIPLIGSRFWGVLNVTDRQDNLPFTPRDLFLGWLSGRSWLRPWRPRKTCWQGGTNSPAFGEDSGGVFSPGSGSGGSGLRILQANSALKKLLRNKGELVGQEISTLLGVASGERESLKNVLDWVLERQEARGCPP